MGLLLVLYCKPQPSKLENFTVKNINEKALFILNTIYIFLVALQV
jgi:hypothetical protein